MIVLGIESTCDETAASLVEDGRHLLSNVISTSVKEQALYGGVVPEIASRRHCEFISATVKKALLDAGKTMDDVDAVAVTFAPGLIGAVLVGVNFAKGLAYSAGKPLVPVHHLRGHIAALYLTHPELKPPFLCLVASGGHSHIVEVQDYTHYHILGHTVDDAAGEAFDKVALSCIHHSILKIFRVEIRWITVSRTRYPCAAPPDGSAPCRPARCLRYPAGCRPAQPDRPLFSDRWSCR